MTAPVVAVTTRRRTDDGRERVVVNTAYVTSLERVGLLPLLVPPTLTAEAGTEVMARVQGLVLTGGEDVDPARYAAPRHPLLKATDPERDEGEIALIAAAREAGQPILGICRGIQILNVAFGGTLYQDLPSERPGPIDHADEARDHRVQIAPASLLARAVGSRDAIVNSRHHQAVHALGAGLVATAWADDGVIEAVEGTDQGGWILGVQWHPEDAARQEVFRAFAEAVG